MPPLRLLGFPLMHEGHSWLACHCVSIAIIFSLRRNNVFIIIYVKGRGRVTKRNRPSADSLLKCPQPLGQGADGARSPELTLDLAGGWQEPKYVSPDLPPLRARASRKLGWRLRSRLSTQLLW